MFLLVKMCPLVKLRYTQTTDSSINYTGLNKNFVYNKQLFVIEPNKKDPWSTGTNGNVQLTAHCTSICTIDEKSRLLGWFSPVFVPSFHLNTDILFHHWTELLWDLNLIIEGVNGVPNVSWTNQRNTFLCTLFWLYPNTQLGHTDVGATKPEKKQSINIIK